MKASDLFVKCLEEENVEYIFGVPGEENADFMISLLDSSIKFIVCRHEQGAAFMADGYGRVTGKPACCLGTLGPGATNLLTGVGDANMDRAPLIVLTGQAATTRIHKESHQAMDLVAIFDPCVKWGVQITHPDTIPEIVRKAFRIATTDKFGACHIDLPENVAKMNTLAQPMVPLKPARSGPNPQAVDDAARIIRNSKFPIILSGNGVFRNKASGALRRFVLENGIPAVNTFMGKGAVPASDPLCLFTIGLGARDYPDAAVEMADCVISVGFDMVEYHPELWNRGDEKTIIHIDNDPSEVDENYRPAVEVIGDVGLSLEALHSAVHGMTPVGKEKYESFKLSMEDDFNRYSEDTDFPIKPQRVLSDVRRYLDDDAIIFSDVGAHKMWIARYLQSEEPNTIQISNGFCSMGFALPASMAAKLAYPERQVLAICGDGGFMMNVQDLETAVREHLNVVFMVWTDSQYGLIKWKQETQFGKHSHIDFTNPDWMQLAKAFGMPCFCVDKAENLCSVMHQAFTAGKPALIEVPIDYRENMKLTMSLSKIPIGDLCDQLANVSLFSGLPEAHRRAFAEIMDEQDVDRGTVIFEQGDPGDSFYVIYSGSVSVRKDGREVTELGAGDYFGEMSALSDARRSATIVALEDTVVSRLHKEKFHDLILAQPEIALELSAIFSERLNEYSEEG